LRGDHLIDALEHFPGGLVGEGDGEDLSWGDALGDHVGDAACEGARLAGARAREDQHWATVSDHGFALLRVQRVEIKHAGAENAVRWAGVKGRETRSMNSVCIGDLQPWKSLFVWGMTRQQVLDLYFMDARCKLIEVAAFLDRVDRGTGDADFRYAAFRQALAELAGGEPRRAENVLKSLSDPTLEPIAKAPGKGAVGAWPGPEKS
jgi:hypothetical protein